MALISQILSASYPAVLADMRKPANQWAENTLLRELEKQGAIVHKSFGPTLEAPLDYKRNDGAGFLASELQLVSMTKTEVITTASYVPAELSVPIVWSKADEVQNPSTNQKIALVKSLLENAITSHDDLIEQALFATSTNGFLGLLTFMPTNGQGTVGGIDSGTYTWFRNQQATYVDDTDIEAAMTSAWNAASKGSGSTQAPSIGVSDGATNAIFEGTQQALQRYDSQDFKAGAKSLMFKTMRYVFSQYGTSSIFMFNAKNLKLLVSKEYFRDRSETQEIQNANGFVSKIYSSLQMVTDNKSRLAVVHV